MCKQLPFLIPFRNLSCAKVLKKKNMRNFDTEKTQFFFYQRNNVFW